MHGDDKVSAIDRLIGSLAPEEAEGVREWLTGGGTGDMRSGTYAPRHRAQPLGSDLFRPRDDDPQAVRSVGVIGGGTAGYLAAFGLKVKRPWLDVTLVESPQIPIIGVGEATVPYLLLSLHHYFGVDIEELYREVRPTWKLGIKFEWGPHPDGIMGPFDWNSDSIGTVGALKATGTINGCTLESLFMMADRTGVFDVDGGLVSWMKYLPFAYHLDNARFVAYLTKLAKRAGVKHLEATLDDVVLGGREWVDHLTTTDGRELKFDMYVDCTGFRSRLLGNAMGTEFHSYADTLFTDRAVTGNVPHGGHLKPYTTATTMNSGWCWNIPTEESDHCGYVHSSAAISEDQAADELARLHPGISEPKLVKFRSGRHDKAWRGNVMAIGNAYAFVEPLESTGVLMIAIEVQRLAAALPASWADPQLREVVNLDLGNQWDSIRWLLGLHYRFNTRLDTPFWKECRSSVNVSGFQPLLDVYASGAPLTRRNAFVQQLAIGAANTYFGLGGVDALLLGQQVPTRLLEPDEPMADWRRRRSSVEAVVRRGLPQREALKAFREHPELNHQLLHDPDSWARAELASHLGLA